MTVKMFPVLALVLAARQVYMFSMGAPDSACQAITPGHNHPPQTDPSPANLSLSSNLVAPGGKITVKLTTSDNSTFKGFIIQARNMKLKDQQVGSFIVSGDDVSYMTCGRGIHNSITHRKATSKTSIQAQWMAPSDFEGDVIFRFTFLKEYKTFWIGAETERVRISRSPPAEEEPADTSEDDELEPSPKSDEAIQVVDKVVENNIEYNGVADKAGDEDDEDIPQPAQNADIARPSSATEEKLGEEEENTPKYISSTTTLRPSTTTTPAPRREPVTGGQLTQPSDQIFEGCNSTKACFGSPAGCVESGLCEMVVAYWPDKQHYTFQMKGRSNGYISMGLSKDNTMGDDLTTSCVINTSGRVDINTGLNQGHSGNKQIQRGNAKDPKDGITERINNYRKDGWISCSWKRKAEMTIDGQSWSLASPHRYHLMLARGPVNEDGKMRKHEAMVVSGSPRGLGQPGSVASKSKLLIFLHGAFMIAAWVCSASLGIILARYYKQTWTSRSCYNLDQWFIWHRTFMTLTWALTIAGFILILLEVQGITQTLFDNPHAFIGFVTVGLCFIQPFLALMRCSPNDSMRPLFNWVHWFIGNSAQILGIVAIFYAVDLTKAELPRPQTDWLLVAFVAFHFLTHLVLSCISCVQEQNKINYPPRMRHMSRNGHVFPDYEELKGDSSGSGLRIFVLVVYFIINIIVTAALILLVVLAPTRTKLENLGLLPQTGDSA